MLYFPDKKSPFYFLIAALLLCLFSLRTIYFMKNLNISYFSLSLSIYNLLLILLSFFSTFPQKSFLLLADIFLVSIYFILFFHDRSSDKTLFSLLVSIISILSFVNILRSLVQIPFLKPGQPFFISTIHEGIVSGFAVLILVYYLMKHKEWQYIILLVLNVGGVFVSRSKAAYIGMFFFSILVILSVLFRHMEKEKRRRFIIIFAGVSVLFVILTFTIPNPIKSTFYYSLKKDPYVFDRIDIWKMSLTVFKENSGTGVGLDNFSEVSGRYNFKQAHGPANYFKVAGETHNDYLQLVTEIGVAGLIVILVLFFFLFKAIFASIYDLSNLLILYLLFQSLFFNILFSGFFLFIFLFLLKNILEKKITFISFTKMLKTFFCCLLIFVFAHCYLFPWISSGLVDKAAKATSIIRSFNLLKKAEYITPLDPKIHYLKALFLYNFFNKTTGIDSFQAGVGQLKKAQRLNPYFIDAYLLESEFYRVLLKKGIKYSSMDKEILSPLEKAEILAPVNPFIKMTKAGIYYEFNRLTEAEAEAKKALALEPEFVAALYFLHKNFHYLDPPTFDKRIGEILKKAAQLNPGPDHYLYRLYEIPRAYK